MRKLIIMSDKTPALVVFKEAYFNQASDPVRTLNCLLCDWDLGPGDLIGWSPEDVLAAGETHADQPHDHPYPTITGEGSTFGWDVSALLDRYAYDPAGQVTDLTVTALAPVIAVLLHGQAQAEGAAEAAGRAGAGTRVL